jgi:predicted RND superfamily exporter protein
MKLSTLSIAAILSSFLFFSCSNTSNESANENQEINESETTEIITEESHHHDEDEAIVLDNGKKWVVVETMIVYIRNMEQAVNNFKGTESKDYTALAKIINENVAELTTKCTMEGQGHDELHKWLVPFLGYSEQFDVATDLAEQEKIYQDFKASFVEFNTYFE